LLNTVAVANRDRNAPGRIAEGPTRCSSKDKEFFMLVLSRKVGERIHVGDNIVLEIRRIAGNRVTLALDAPRDIRILRGELEAAARAFDAPGPQRDEATPDFPRTHRMPLLNNLPAQALGRDCVS
jgi:carbon storage regulator